MRDKSDKTGIFARIGAAVDGAVRDYFSDFLSIASPLLASWWFSIPVKNQTLATVLILLLAIVTGVGGVVIRHVNKPTRSNLEARASEAEEKADQSSRALVEVVQPIAHNLADHLELDAVHQRISIYCHYDGEFRILSREAKREDFKSIRRINFPDSQGVIGQIWRDGDKTVRLGKDKDWLEWTMEFGFSDNEARALPMKSESFCGLRLEHNRKRVGIILLESTNKTGVNGTHLELLKESLIMKSLAGLLYVAAPYFPEEPLGIEYFDQELT